MNQGQPTRNPIYPFVLIAFVILPLGAFIFSFGAYPTRAETTGASAPEVTSESPTASPPPAPSASAQLEDRRQQNEKHVDELTGSWVPQIASAEVSDDRDPATLASDHVLEATFGALLIKSSDFSAWSTETAFWVDIAPFSSADEGEATKWCDDHGQELDGCHAIFLLH